MKPCVLIATPVRTTTPVALINQAYQIGKTFTWPAKKHTLYFNNYPPAVWKYANNARARNALIEARLEPQHTHVLWLDVDLVDVPADLIERLLAISDKDIVAPMVLIENGHEWTDRFYDVGGFVDLSGDGASMWPPYFFDGDDVIEMMSVGSCYLVPAELYRSLPNPWYKPERDEVEHVSFCKEARWMGYKVYATRKTIVRHAYLPAYGEVWH